MAYLELYNILEVFQSGIKASYNTKSALLKDFNDIFFASDSRESVVHVLLDLTVAFDTVDYEILLSRLEQSVGIRDTALKWFKSYLVERTFCFSLADYVSSSASLLFGVP